MKRTIKMGVTTDIITVINITLFLSKVISNFVNITALWLRRSPKQECYLETIADDLANCA